VRKIYSLKGTKAFSDVFRKGRRFGREGIQLIVLRTRNNGDSSTEPRVGKEKIEANIKIGISINSKYGNAIIRNKAKRRIRAICNELLPALDEGYFIIVRPGNEFKTVEFEQARMKVRQLFHKAGILRQ